MFYLLVALLGGACGAVVCFWAMWKFALQVAKNKERRITMFSSYFYTLDRWLTLRRKGKTLGDWLATKKNVKTVVIYGMGVMGRQFVAELTDSPVTISYAIDQAVANNMYPFPIYSMKEPLPPADLVVVTPTYAYQAIAAQLTSCTDNPVVSAEDLVKEWYDDAAKT